MAITNEEFLAHYGVKGMRWGQSNAKATGSGGAGGQAGAPQKTKLSRKQKAVRIGGAALAVAGTAAAVAVLAKNGKTPSIDLGKAANAASSFNRAAYDAAANRSRSQTNSAYNRRTQETVRNVNAQRNSDAGKKAAASAARQAEWKKSVNDLLGDMRQANREQDAYMRSLGLGAAVNRG